MDTRNKILTAAAALAIPRPFAIVTGTFDVLRAEHARELQEARSRSGAARLLVIVLPRSSELLPQCARAELVAALRVVDYVVASGPLELEGILNALEPIHLVRLEEADELRSRQLREQIVTKFQP